MYSAEAWPMAATAMYRGGWNGQILRKSNFGAGDRLRARRADRGVPRLRLLDRARRPLRRRRERHGHVGAPVAARPVRNYLDRPALLFQFRADTDNADHPTRAEARSIQIYRAQSVVLFPLGGGVHRADRAPARLGLRRVARGDG